LRAKNFHAGCRTQLPCQYAFLVKNARTNLLLGFSSAINPLLAIKFLCVVFGNFLFIVGIYPRNLLITEKAICSELLCSLQTSPEAARFPIGGEIALWHQLQNHHRTKSLCPGSKGKVLYTPNSLWCFLHLNVIVSLLHHSELLSCWKIYFFLLFFPYVLSYHFKIVSMAFQFSRFNCFVQIF